MATVLVVHDDPASRTALIRELASAGHAVRSVSHVEDALATVTSDPPDVLVVGLEIRDAHSVEVVRGVRTLCQVPMLVSTPRADEAAVTRLLRNGADGVVARVPLRGLLVARVAALVRRSLRASAAYEIYSVGGLRLDPRRRLVTMEGRRLRLTPREFDLLAYLVRRRGGVVSRRGILTEVWNSAYVDPQTVDVHLSSLRRKLGETASAPRYLWTVRGVGVRVDVPDDVDLAEAR
jgi:two-component system, OmpR family, response regulator PrrA